MTCCGRARSQAAASRTEAPRSRENAGGAAPRSREDAGGAAPRETDAREQQDRQPAAPADVLFEYRGASALTATGPASGRRYRFDRPGARVAVDARDALGLRQVPRLRPV